MKITDITLLDRFKHMVKIEHIFTLCTKYGSNCIIKVGSVNQAVHSVHHNSPNARPPCIKITVLEPCGAPAALASESHCLIEAHVPTRPHLSERSTLDQWWVYLRRREESEKNWKEVLETCSSLQTETLSTLDVYLCGYTTKRNSCSEIHVLVQSTWVYLRESLVIVKATSTTYWECCSIWDIMDSYPESLTLIVNDAQAHAKLQETFQQNEFKSRLHILYNKWQKKLTQHKRTHKLKRCQRMSRH